MVASFRTYLARQQWLFFALLALLTIPALWVLLTDGLPSRFDRGLHIMRLAYLDQHIRQGTLFPRWVPEMMLGRGYPLFNFYGAGVYYLSEAFHLMGLNLSDASVATLIVLVLLAAGGIYLWTRDIFAEGTGNGPVRVTPWASLVAAIAYVYAPYFLVVNIYNRGAIAEATAQALIPWVLWCARRLFTSQKQPQWALALALLLATLAFSHTLMLLIFPPFLAGYILMLWLQTGRGWQKLGWAILALVTAIGISAFFWLPLIAERDNLSKFAYGIVRGAFLPRSTWKWDSFFAKEWLYTYSRPPRLGLVQFLLGLVGAFIILIRRRTWENCYLIFSAVVAGMLVGEWARPLWESSEILLSIQSPWRLLTIISLVLAICTGAIVAYLPFKQLGMIVALLLLGGIIYANLPRLQGLPYFSRTDTVLSPPSLAQLEYEQGVETGGEGSTFVQEFRPLWASRSLLYTEPPALSAPAIEIQPAQGNAYTTALRVQVAESTPLRFNHFYFPGWQVQLEDGSTLPTYPSTNLGLLTVDLPAGDHQVILTWQGTQIQRLAGAISMATLAILAALYWWQGRRKMAIVPAVLLVVALFATFSKPAIAKVEAAAQPLEANGVRYLGYRLEQTDPTHLYIHPYWYVLSGGPDPNFKARWQLVNDAGNVQAEILSGPYYNASTPRTWPPGTLIEDAYMLPLPPGLPAGSYQLKLQLQGEDAANASEFVQAGTITLAQPVPAQQFGPYVGEITPVNALFDNEILLAGYDAPSGESDALTNAGQSADAPLRFHAGQDALYRLYWRAAQTPSENYHSYIHLLDSLGNAIYHSDQLPGPWFRPPKGWDNYYLQQDTHLLEIPAGAPGGLYWPAVGLYEIRQMNNLAITVDGEPVPGDVYRLPPIKVIGAPAKPSTPREAHFDDGFQLLGYDLDIPAEGLHAGDSFEVTLYFQSDEPTSVDYTRFFHLYNPDLGLAAQFDSPPQNGVNPTWSWVPGEIIVDTIKLQVAEDAAPGEYRLFTGFYDAQAGGARLGVRDEADQPLPDSGVILQTIQVE